MKGFQFRLDAVLRWRQLQLDTEKAKLSELIAEEQKATAALHRGYEERVKAKTLLCEQRELEPVQLRLFSSFNLAVEARAGALRDTLRRLNQTIAEQRQRVAFAERKVRLLTKLRERKLETWKAERELEIETLAQESWTAGRQRALKSSNSP
jgi:uncharacterized coiled-coil protein SlyX